MLPEIVKAAEEPLRDLRGMQLAARFDLVLDEATAELARSLSPEYDSLAIERVWGEWCKWASQSVLPSRGLHVLAATGWLEHYPELAALPGVPQDAQWHPEGDVWIHTLHVCDAAAKIANRDELDAHERTILLLAALCHDLGKPATTAFLEGHWRARGHCEAGVAISRTFLERIGCPEAIIQIIEPLVAEHLVHAQHVMNPRVVRRLTQRMGTATIAQLVRLIEADMNGRPPLPGGLPSTVQTLVELSEGLNVNRSGPKPLILGRHLIALGHRPDVWFGEVLKQCFEAQLDGAFSMESDGIEFLKTALNAMNH